VQSYNCSRSSEHTNLDLLNTGYRRCGFLHIADGYLLRADYFGSGVIWYLIYLSRVLAGISVPVFIMTSGYLTIGKKYTLSGLFGRILTRLFIPFMFLFVITSWIDGVSSTALHNTVLHTPLVGLSDLLIKVFTAPGGLHFLVALIGLNLLMPIWNLVFSPANEKNNFQIVKYLIALGFVGAFSISLNQSFNFSLSGEVLNEWRWLLWVGYFLLGYLLKIKTELVSRKKALILLLIGLIVSLVISFISRKLMIFNPENETFASFAKVSLDYHSPWLVLMSIGAWALLVRTNFLFLKNVW
jgi:surface polysaccharide O-acyltransferase-like enzyme